MRKSRMQVRRDWLNIISGTLVLIVALFAVPVCAMLV